MGGYWGFRNFALKLLDRPEPPREAGSRWRDPETGAEYVKTDTDVPGGIEFLCYAQGPRSSRSGKSYRGAELNAWDADIIARLVPLDDES
jgi:hypothetical protein